MEVLKKYKSQILFHFTLNVGFLLFISFSSYIHLPLDGWKDYVFYFLHLLVLQFTVFGFLYFLSLHKLLFSIIVPLLFLPLTFIAFWVYTQDIVVSYQLIEISVETKPDIVLELISFPLVLTMLAAIIFLVILIKWHQKLKPRINFPFILLAIIGILGYFAVEYMRYGTLKRRLPYNVYFALADYNKQNPLEFKQVQDTVSAKNKRLHILFVLGESVRADHLGVNGYHRSTTPLLSKRQNIISYSRAYTTHTYTGISVPQILTDASIQHQNELPKYALIDILNKADIPTTWLGNQTPEKSYEYFINQSQKHKILDPMHNELSFQKAFDEVLIDNFSSLKELPSSFSVLHMMGSHWFYESRYPKEFRIYKPLADSKYIPSNDSIELINSYDNTIRYLDYFLDKLIAKIEKDTDEILLIYLADHGETLGENGKWLHAQSNPASMNPALIFWYSEGFEKRNPWVVEELERQKDSLIPLDFLFPTILDLYEIKGISYDHDESLIDTSK